jgi:hypothetical protein
LLAGWVLLTVGRVVTAVAVVEKLRVGADGVVGCWVVTAVAVVEKLRVGADGVVGCWVVGVAQLRTRRRDLVCRIGETLFSQAK